MNSSDLLGLLPEPDADMVVVIAPGLAAEDLPPALRRGKVKKLTTRVARPAPHDAVVLAARDVASLRRAASALSNLGTATQVGVWLERRPATLPLPTPAPDWPHLTSVSGSSGEGFMLFTFAEPAAARPVLTAIARSATPSGSSSAGWPLVGVRRDEPELWPVADPAATVALPARLFDSAVDSPPDVIIVEDSAGSETLTKEEHPVLGRAPSVVHKEPDISWDEIEALASGEVEALFQRRGPLSLGAVDDKLFNPISFDRDPVGDFAPLTAGPASSICVSLPDGAVVIPPSGRVSEADVPRLRSAPGLRLDWRGGHGPQSYCRAVATLAAAGVPLSTKEVPDWAAALLAPGLTAALGQEVDLLDRLRREEHSVRLRRGGLRGHGTAAWRRDLARQHGLQETPEPFVSVLLVTKRPEMVDFALRQLGRQRGVRMEVILATHGFEVDREKLEAFVSSTGVRLETLDVDPSILFGDALNLAAARAQGDVVLKVDDDDWYGPDFVADLMLARSYSGAELVGSPPEFTFVEPLWLTTRRAGSTEVYQRYVAGGTMLVERAALREVGGFRSTRKYVDANLLDAITGAGGRVYRTQGLGYVLRRGERGHTWDPGLGYFVTRRLAVDQWRGFRPSSLLEPDPADLPTRDPEERATP